MFLKSHFFSGLAESLFIFSVLFFPACSSEPKKESRPAEIQKINLLAIEYSAVKTREPSCELPASFYAGLFLKSQEQELRACLASIKGGKAIYAYRFQAAPSLQLISPSASACLQKLLPEIPLPRELFFLGTTDIHQGLECYSAAFNTREKTLVESGGLSKSLTLEIPFPLSHPLKNQTELEQWLAMRTLDLLSQFASGAGLQSEVIPAETCNQCFRNDRSFQDKRSQQIPPVFYRPRP